MEKIKTYVSEHKDRFIQELIELLRIPSVSAKPEHKEDMLKAASWLKEKFDSMGVSRTEIYPTKGHPILYAEKIIDNTSPTVLVYGHYDVQPAEPLELWNSPPFEPVIKDGKIYARGACDDKGQLYMHVKAMEILHELKEDYCNIKVILEGEEEVGSDNLEAFIREKKDMLKCDIILISDTSIISNEHPSITTGLRGLSYVEVEVTGPNRDLHSGVYGGAVANPINILCEMITSLRDDNRKITIPGFYDDVLDLSDEVRKKMAEKPFVYQDYIEDLEIASTDGEEGYSPTELVSIRPTLDVNGIWGGYIGEGAKTVLPSKAFAKISMRLVPNQSSETITKLFEDHFKKIAPPYVKVEVRPHHGGEPAETSIDSAGYRAAERAMKEAFGKTPIPTKEGGSIPIVAMFKEVLKADSVLMGFGLDSDLIHSPNEHFGVFNFLKGIETIPLFYRYYKEEMTK